MCPSYVCSIAYISGVFFIFDVNVSFKIQSEIRGWGVEVNLHIIQKIVFHTPQKL